MKKAVLFDLGGTLIHYYEREEFPSILRNAVSNVTNYLKQQDLLIIPQDSIWQRVMKENYESKNYRVRPLEKRLSRIFELDKVIDPGSNEIIKICQLFMQPIFSIGKCYDDAKPALQTLKSKNILIAIVSNTPWGSPSILWREELKRKGFSSLIDLCVFCRDVGWRKPARPIFKYALKQLGLSAKDCIFVGDDPRWDIIGPKRMNIDAVLLNRKGQKVNLIGKNTNEVTIKSLNNLTKKILLY